MFALFHLIFMLIKIAIQASVYATLIFTLFYGLSLTTRIELLKNWMDSRFVVWQRTALIISLGLFIYAFSYWGDHGLGDSARIPLGYNQAIHNTDGTWTYFYSGTNQKNIEIFALREDKLCAKQDDRNYIIFNLRTSEMNEFHSRQDYEGFASKNNLPVTAEFKDFYKHYHEFWDGWRFYLLP